MFTDGWKSEPYCRPPDKQKIGGAKLLVFSYPTVLTFMLGSQDSSFEYP